MFWIASARCAAPRTTKHACERSVDVAKCMADVHMSAGRRSRVWPQARCRKYCLANVIKSTTPIDLAVEITPMSRNKSSAWSTMEKNNWLAVWIAALLVNKARGVERLISRPLSNGSIQDKGFHKSIYGNDCTSSPLQPQVPEGGGTIHWAQLIRQRSGNRQHKYICGAGFY